MANGVNIVELRERKKSNRGWDMAIANIETFPSIIVECLAGEILFSLLPLLIVKTVN